MLRGCITEVDFRLVDEVFPGLLAYYARLEDKPCTFLELLWAYVHEPAELEPAPVNASIRRAP